MVLSNLAVHRFYKHTHTVALFIFLLVVSYTAALAEGPATVADLLARINKERTSRGLPAYALSAPLTAAAQKQASDIAKTGKYSHIGSDGSTTEQRVARAGYGNAARVGENWAAYRTVDDAMKFWMTSAPHKANILHPLYRDIGIGIASTANGRTVLVLNFGLQATLSSPVAAASRNGPAGPTALAPAVPTPAARPASPDKRAPSNVVPALPTPRPGAKSADVAVTASRTSTPRPSPTRTRTSTPRPARAVTRATDVPPTVIPVPTEAVMDSEESVAAANAVDSAVQVAELVPTAAPYVPAVSALPMQAVITPFDPFAAITFGGGLLLGVLAVFKYMRPGV